MNEIMIIWSTVVSVVVLAFFFRAIENFRKENNPSHKSIHCLEMGDNKEVFYCPGDEEYDTED